MTQDNELDIEWMNRADGSIVIEPKRYVVKSRLGFFSDIGEIHENCTSLAITLSYPGMPRDFLKPEPNPITLRIPNIRIFPGLEYFSPYRFVNAIQFVGWEYHGEKFDARKAMTAWKEKEFGKYIETIPHDLDEYTFTPGDDFPRIILNAERRIKNFRQHDISFGSPHHGGYLSQELYEAGWLLTIPESGFKRLREYHRGEDAYP